MTTSGLFALELRAAARAGSSGCGGGADVLGEDRRETRAMVLDPAEQRGVELGALVEPVNVRLPREADATVGLDRTRGDLARGLGGRGLGHRCRLGQALGIGVRGPRGE